MEMEKDGDIYTLEHKLGKQGCEKRVTAEPMAWTTDKKEVHQLTTGLQGSRACLNMKCVGL